jgi:riboflavin biosynthesis pyrimidine reductase
VVRLPADDAGRVSLPALLAYLHRQHVRSLMIEGGARVIGRVLADRLADRLVLTIAPLLLGGLNAVGGGVPSLNGHLWPALLRPRYRVVGRDVILFGDLESAD